MTGLRRSRGPLLALATCLAVAVPAAAPAATSAPKAPRSGSTYEGRPGDVFLRISGR